MDDHESRGKRLPHKKVFGIKELDPKDGEERGKSVFTPLGVGWNNSDGSVSLYLDAFPIHGGKLYVRDFDEARDTHKGRLEAMQSGNGSGSGASGGSGGLDFGRRGALAPGRSVPNESDVPF